MSSSVTVAIKVGKNPSVIIVQKILRMAASLFPIRCYASCCGGETTIGNGRDYIRHAIQMRLDRDGFSSGNYSPERINDIYREILSSAEKLAPLLGKTKPTDDFLKEFADFALFHQSEVIDRLLPQ